MALVAARADPLGRETCATTLGPKPAATQVPQSRLHEDGPWILVPGAERARRRLRLSFPVVGERWKPQLGVKTGADDLFLTDHAVPHARPALRGRDVSAWSCATARYVLWTHGADGAPLPKLSPELEKRLAAHEERLRRRADYRSGPPWQLFRTALAYAVHRVVWPDIGKRLSAALPPPDAVPLNTLYGIATRTADDAVALAALLNSRWLTALARGMADPARGGFRRFNARVVAALPVPPADSPGWRALARHGDQREPADDLVADLLELDAADRRALASDSL
jgi:hypothetical protein